MSNDAELKQAVLAALKWEPSVNAAHIGVTAKDGVVTLSGTVENYSEKSGAEKATRRVRSVKAVAEEIEVTLPSSVKYGDQDIAAAAIERLRWNSTIPENSVKVEINKGWITLTGEVDWRYQHDAAADDIRGLWGVVGVSNQITIKPRSNVNVSDIRDNIMAALDRSGFDPKTITVTALDGKVKITGTVGSWHSSEIASATAWASPGTISVENHLAIV